jgi:hypothetical protein
MREKRERWRKIEFPSFFPPTNSFECPALLPLSLARHQIEMQIEIVYVRVGC